MGVDWRARNHGEALGLQCLEPQLIGAAGDRRLDAGGKQSFEDIEQDLLHGDGERQHTVEEGADAGQVITPTDIVVAKFEAGPIFEGDEAAAFYRPPLSPREE